MFEVRCLVADKRLADVLRSLRKLTLEPPVTIAVDEPHANGATPAVVPSKNSHNGARQTVEEWVEAQVKKGVKQITATQLRNLMIESGFSDRSYSYPLDLLVKRKVLKATRVSGTYEVV